jgi:hypothetical protein
LFQRFVVGPYVTGNVVLVEQAVTVFQRLVVGPYVTGNVALVEQAVAVFQRFVVGPYGTGNVALVEQAVAVFQRFVVGLYVTGNVALVEQAVAAENGRIRREPYLRATLTTTWAAVALTVPRIWRPNVCEAPRYQLHTPVALDLSVELPEPTGG